MLQIVYGRDPYYSTCRRLNGFGCMIKINSTQGCTVECFQTEQQAQDAAAVQACETYISATDEELVQAKVKRRDPSSDKEVYIPDADHTISGGVSRWPEI
jgi:hypothetical protein